MVILILSLFSILLYIYFKKCFNYWQKQQIPTVQPYFPLGNVANPLKRGQLSWAMSLEHYYKEFKSQGCKHAGLYYFTRPVYLLIAPDFIKNVLQNDFQDFADRGRYYNERDDPISAHLFHLGGAKWQTHRRMLTPTFTSGKMKMMFDTLKQCSHQMKDAMDEMCEKNTPIEIKDLVARFTTDVIGSCAFGIDCNSFKNPDAEFRRYGRKVYDEPPMTSVIESVVAMWLPELAKHLRFVLLPRDSTKFFYKVVKEMVNFREITKTSRNDMLQLLIELKNNTTGEKHDNESMTVKELAAEAFVFFAAGFETSSTTMMFCLFELAQNPEMQERVRRDINSVLNTHHGIISYDSVKEMQYLQQVIQESLRKYPPLPFVTRRCVRNYRVPNTEITLEKGTLVYVPILSLHRDEEYFPDPEKFDPERFNALNKKDIRPFTFLPFGEGPRNCIGSRFGLMQVGLGLTTLLKNYEFSINGKTDTPLKITCHEVILTVNTGIWLNAKKIV